MSQDNANHWAQMRETGPLLGMRFLLRAYGLGGRPLFQVFLFPVVLFYSLAHAPSRLASRDYRARLRRFKPDFPAPRPWHAFRHLWNFANALLDKMAVWMGKITRADVVLHGGELVEQLLSEGRGAVLLVSHLGNFEICKALSEGRQRLDMTILHHDHNAKKFNEVLGHFTKSSRLEFIQVTSLGVVEAMMLSERLARGQFLAISADRVPVDNRSRVQLHDFLGSPAAFPSGPFILAMSLHAPLLAVQCIKQGKKYHISFEQLSTGEPVPRSARVANITAWTAAYVDNLERHCLRAPWQWFNFYPFWNGI